MRQSDWSDLKLFLHFVRSGSTRAAGDALGLSHSTVARRLEAMHVLAGGPLYHRRGGKIELSSLGQEVLTTATAIEDEIVNLDRRTFGHERGLAGPVALSMGDVLSVQPMMGILHDFSQRHPSVDLRLITSASVSDLDRRDADLALRFSQSPDDHLIGRKLARTARAIYLSRDNYMRAKDGTPVDEIGWISFSPLGSSESWKKNTPFPKVPTRARINDMRTQKAACIAGFGLVLLPCILCDPDPNLVRITTPEFVPRQDLWLLRHAELKKNARVRALSDHLAQNIPKLAPILDGVLGTTHELSKIQSPG